MDFTEANKLKADGDKAKQEGMYVQALRIYAAAFHMIKKISDSTLAEILASTAEIKLDQKHYEHAIEAATDSLSLDSSLIKSLFIRVNAFDKLGHKMQASIDLRKILDVDPMNMKARNLLRGIAPPVKMAPAFRDAFVAHFLRRSMLKPCGYDQESKNAYWRSLKIPLLRIAFVSTKCVNGFRRLLVGASILEAQSDTGGIVQLMLPSWFVLKHLKYAGNLNSTVNVLLSRKGMIQMLKAVRPGGMTLNFSSVSFVTDFLQAWNFSYVIYNNEDDLLGEEAAPASVEAIKKVTKSLTRLPYFFEVSSFEPPQFPHLHTVVIASQFSINIKFLKAWYEYIWPTKQIVFSKPVDKLDAFKKFKSKIPISESVVKIHMALGEDNCELTRQNELESVSKHLEDLKRYFPSLRDAYGTLKFTFPDKDLTQVCAQLKNYLHYLATHINKKIKPGWCPKLRVLMKFVCELDAIKEMQEKPDLLFEVIDECKSKLKNIRSANLSGPSAVDFDWKPNVCCHAMIELVTDDAFIQVPFLAL